MKSWMSEQTIVGKRFTIVVPKSLRRKLNLREGQTIMMRAEEGKLLIEPLPADPYAVLKKVIGKPYEERKDERKAEAWIKSRAGH